MAKTQNGDIQTAERFARIFGAEATEKFIAPGRFNIIGEHIDYCGGKVLPAALTLNCDMYTRLNGTNEIRLVATTTEHRRTLDIHKLNSYRNLVFGLYQAGVAYYAQQSGIEIKGMDILLDCHVPFGSGLSSSAAIEVVMAAACYYYAGKELDKKAIALLGQKAEREYCNVNCGIMDQYASAFGKEHNAMLLDCAAVSHEYVPVDLGEYAFVLTDCKKPHSLVESKYNERFAQAAEAAKILKLAYPDFKWTDCTTDMLDLQKDNLGDVLFRRARHIVTECKRVDAAVIAMKNGDMKTLGELLNASHASLQFDYETTGAEPDILTSLARDQDGCIGSRLTGGGFGGCALSLVHRTKLDSFATNLSAQYESKTTYKPSFYNTDLGGGLKVEKL